VETKLRCSTVFRGDANAGEACNAEEDCRAVLTCDLSGGCPGKCKALPGIGEPCTWRCTTGLDCISPGICKTRTPRGQACETETCERGSLCDRGEGRTNTCRRYADFSGTRATGQSCRLQFECSTDDFCSSDTSLCTPKLPAGAPCHPNNHACMDGMHCSGNGDSTVAYPGACIPNIPVGGACDSNLSVIQCEDGAGCISNTCAYAVRLREPCNTHEACISLYCDSGRCAVKPACFGSAI
jgi:hypothetical protein